MSAERLQSLRRALYVAVVIILSLLAAIPHEAFAQAGVRPQDIVGAREVQGWGGRVHSIAFEHERSTTTLLRKIRER